MQLGKASSGLAGLLLSLAGYSGIAKASELEWRGFFTTGLAVTDSKVSYRDGVNRKARVAEETYLGLNLSKEINSEWRVAGQILGRAGEADTAAKVDWAFVTYEPNSQYDIVLGKQMIPIWMISEYIDVGRAYPWAEPPEEVYSLFPLKSFTGAAAAYHLALGESVLTLQPYGGDVIYETSPSAPTTISKIRGDNMFGLSLEWKWGQSLLRAAYNQASWDFDFGPTLNFGVRKIEMYSVGFKSEFDGYLIMAEYASQLDRDEDHYLALSRELAAQATTAPAAEQAALATRSALLSQRIGGSRGYYGTLGKEFFEDFLLHLTYASGHQPSSPQLSRDQTSVALGLNYDVNPDSVIKLQAKRISIPGDSQGLFLQKPEHSEAMIYRLGYSMIF